MSCLEMFSIPKPTYSVTANGQFKQSGASSYVNLDFTQAGQSLKKQYASFTGDKFHECLTVIAAFPGAKGFCGGYKSPLMVFFDEGRPHFLGSSYFPLRGKSNLVAWPEKNSPGWFLAFDKYKNKKILSGDQLFTDGPQFKNGFESLRKLDTNKDGVIDKKDKDFHRLLLWKDKNADGLSHVSKKADNEVIPLAQKKVVSISLKYLDDPRRFKKFGGRAQGRQSAEFTFKIKNKKTKKWQSQKGQIIDMWF